MLSLASWKDKALALGPGERSRTDHDCGPGRTLTIKREDSGYNAFCFRCNDHGYIAAAPEPLDVRLKRLQKQHDADASIQNAVCLPTPQVTAWADWPAASRLWLLKAGLSSADLPRLGAYYHPPTNRVVLPVLDPSLRILFWQARATDGRQPKYMAPLVDKTGVIPMYGKAQDVTLTEDILSAYKVGTVAEGWSLLGTSISKATLAALVARGCRVNVWLDPDPPGRRAAAKVLATLRGTGIEARDIRSSVDPKLVHKQQIKEYLLWHLKQDRKLCVST